MKKINCVLLIDDNVNDNFFHIRVIRKSNVVNNINTTTTGEEAINYFELHDMDPEKYPFPDLIFLDINMPGMNGFEFIEKAKQLNIFNEDRPVLIVMLTSSLNSNDEKMAREKFAQEIKEFRNKPLTDEMLNELIETHFK